MSMQPEMSTSAGNTASSNFNTTQAFQGARNGTSDGFLLKFDPTGAPSRGQSYFGGNNVDSINDIAIDS